MAITIVKKDPYSLHITAMGEDFDWATQGCITRDGRIDQSVPLNSICFVPGQANDELIVRDGSITGPIIFHALCLNTDEKIQYYHGSRKQPCIDFSECTVAGGTHYILFDIAKYN